MPLRNQHSRRVERQARALGDANLPVHQVDPAHHLGHGMLDLKPCVHLKEVKPSFRIEQKLDRPRVGISDASRQRGGRVRQAAAQARTHRYRWRLFDDLLMAALDRTFPFDKRDHGAVLVTQQLDLHMAGSSDLLFEIDRRITERGSGLRSRAADGGREIHGTRHQTHALSAPAGDGLDEQRESDLRRQPLHLRIREPLVEWFTGAWHHRNARFDGGLARGGLPAHQLDDLGRRPDEEQAGVSTRLRECRILCEKAIPGVHRIGLRPSRRLDDGVNIQIAPDGLVRTDAHGLVGISHVGRRPIALRIDGDGREPHFAAGAHNPDGYFTSIGDENLHEPCLPAQ